MRIYSRGKKIGRERPLAATAPQHLNTTHPPVSPPVSAKAQTSAITRMAKPSPCEIPQEIIDKIIDLCSADKKTLKACSLISRAWVDRTRKHLFSRLRLTDETLITWCEVIAAATSDIEPPLPRATRPPASSSYAPSWPSSYVKSLELVPARHPVSRNIETALQANTHLSAFINLETLSLSAVSLESFQEASLGTCFGSLATTVRKLVLSRCSLGGNILAFLKVFTQLKSLQLHGNVWTHRRFVGPPLVLPEDLPPLRGSFTVSNSTHRGNELVDFFATASAEYHAITINRNPPSMFRSFNALFAKCGDHLRVLAFTRVAPRSRNMG